jgi:hypothetical protein
MVGKHSSEDEHIEFDDLITQGVTMLRLAKAALIYLATYLSRDQKRKTSHVPVVTAPLLFRWQHEMR